MHPQILGLSPCQSLVMALLLLFNIAIAVNIENLFRLVVLKLTILNFLQFRQHARENQ